MLKSLENKVIVVTGGTGSMGKTFVHRLLTGELGQPKKIIVLSRDEGKQHAMRLDYLHKKISTDEIIYNNFTNLLEFQIGDVRNYDDVCRVAKQADVIINAAALKQVPSCEYFPYQALNTNCIGAYNIFRAIHEHDYPVNTVCSISTDKACKPINVMGMTKAIQEKIFISSNIFQPSTRFICVRYGNVLASRGSVIPLFRDQILHGGPVTLTLPHMTRFLLSLNDAVDTVFAALMNAQPGEIFVPIAPSATVENIAKALIGQRKIDVTTQGIRPGEKIHEILVSDEEANYCIKRGNYYAIRPMLPELQKETKTTNILSKEYSSGDNVLSLKETINLLEQHRLLLKESDQKTDMLELLR